MDKPILLTVLSTDTLVDIRDTITAGDSDAYPLSITFSDLTAITGNGAFPFRARRCVLGQGRDH